MPFSPEQIAALSAPLDRGVVKTRQQAGQSLSYVEAYHCENEANRIFGFDAWDRETELTLLGEPRIVNDKYRVAYRAKVRITVRTPDGVTVIREGCGFGSGIDKDVDQAHESALKEAESDAEKRALKTFGNPFGQALYDKEQSDVADTPTAADRFMVEALKAIDGAKTLDELKATFTEKTSASARQIISKEQVAKLAEAKDKRKANLTPKIEENPFTEAAE